jgi:hypothetical protein
VINVDQSSASAPAAIKTASKIGTNAVSALQTGRYLHRCRYRLRLHDRQPNPCRWWRRLRGAAPTPAAPLLELARCGALRPFQGSSLVTALVGSTSVIGFQTPPIGSRCGRVPAVSGHGARAWARRHLGSRGPWMLRWPGGSLCVARPGAEWRLMNARGQRCRLLPDRREAASSGRRGPGVKRVRPEWPDPDHRWAPAPGEQTIQAGLQGTCSPLAARRSTIRLRPGQERCWWEAARAGACRRGRPRSSRRRSAWACAASRSAVDLAFDGDAALSEPRDRLRRHCWIGTCRGRRAMPSARA